MDLRRRDFLKQGLVATAWSGAIGGLGLSVGWPATAKASEFFVGKNLGEFPILQGWTDEQSAQFRVSIDPRQPVHYRFRDSRGFDLPHVHLERFVHPSSKKDAIDHLEVRGLRIGDTYSLEVIDEASGKTLDQREFSALDTVNAEPRFVLLSCMNDSYKSEQGAMWAAVEQVCPTALFFIGDTCYADQGADGSEADLWRRHVETRKRLDVFRWKRLVPSFGVWDDHDFGKNNSDSRSSLRQAAKVVFEAHFQSKEAPGCYEHGPGISSSVSLFGQRFFLMDDRFFRSAPGVSGGTHWGEDQEEWLFSQLGANREPAWLLNGSQFFGGYLGKESFESDHPEQMARVLKRLSKLDAPVMFGSGDVHFSELMRIEKKLLGYETFEFTSSSVHSFTFPGHQYRAHNPRREVSTSKHNFLLIQSELARDGGVEIRVRSRGAEASTLFDRRLVVTR